MTYHVQFPGLGLEFTLDRVAFTVFGMPIYWYGILIATKFYGLIGKTSCSHSAMRDVSALIPTAWWM